MFLWAFTGFAQIQYFTTVNNDIDEDGVEDFEIINEYESVLLGADRISVYKGFFYPKNGLEVINNGEYIKTCYFNDSINIEDQWTSIWKLKIYYAAIGISYIPGSWFKEGNDFVGIRIRKGGDYYYGWLRRYGILNTQIIEAAIQQMPNLPVFAGEGINSIKPLTPSLSDKYNNGDWSDVYVYFYSPFYSSFVKEYRLFVVENGKEQNYVGMLVSAS